MMALRAIQNTFARLAQIWSRIWFEPSATAPLELARIGLGAALLGHYALATSHLAEFWGNAGWMPRQLLEKEYDSALAEGEHHVGMSALIDLVARK